MISQFSPQQTDPEILERIFVKREPLVQHALERVRESALTGSRHHILFVGPRGSGKTHLLSLIAHRVRQETTLTPTLRVARLNEDELVTSFLKLLLRIFEALAAEYPDEYAKEFPASLRGLPPDTALRVLESEFLDCSKGKCVLVMLENLDALFEAMPEGELRRWRGFLQDHHRIATIATAQRLFAGVSSQQETFYGFFNVQHLAPFKADEAQALLRKIAELKGDPTLLAYLDSPQGRARISAIHHLSGGSPRLYVMFSDLISAEALDNLVLPFEEMADRQLTPYYQERLRWLSAQQREIVQYLCQQIEAVSVKTIAEAIFAAHSSVTKQLQDLREKGYVIADERGREMLYQLAEPLMRLALQNKDTRDQRPLPLIVDFLRVWYSREELGQQHGRSPKESAAAEYLKCALERENEAPGEFRKRLYQSDLTKLDPKSWQEIDEAKELRAMEDYFTTPQGGLSRASFQRARSYVQPGRHDDAIADYSRAIERPLAPPDLVAMALHLRAWEYCDHSDSHNAMSDYRSLAHLGFTAPTAEMLDWSRTATNIVTHTYLLHSINPPWGEDARTFAAFFHTHRHTSELSNALIGHLSTLAELAPGLERLAEWETRWHRALSPFMEYAAALRMLRAGLSWLKTRADTALAPLVLEERRVVRDALGIPLP